MYDDASISWSLAKSHGNSSNPYVNNLTSVFAMVDNNPNISNWSAAVRGGFEGCFS